MGKYYYHKNKDKSSKYAKQMIEACGIIGEKVGVENIQSEICQILDRVHGIDWVNRVRPGKYLGIATRVQFVNKGHSTGFNDFTIRYKLPSGRDTEYQKRVRAIKTNDIIPEITIQGYVRNCKLIAACAVSTIDLYKFVVEHPMFVKHETPYHQNTGETFLCISWKSLKAFKIPLVIYDGIKHRKKSVEPKTEIADTFFDL